MNDTGFFCPYLLDHRADLPMRLHLCGLPSGHQCGRSPDKLQLKDEIMHRNVCKCQPLLHIGGECNHMYRFFFLLLLFLLLISFQIQVLFQNYNLFWKFFPKSSTASIWITPSTASVWISPLHVYIVDDEINY